MHYYMWIMARISSVPLSFILIFSSTSRISNLSGFYWFYWLSMHPVSTVKFQACLQKYCMHFEKSMQSFWKSSVVLLHCNWFTAEKLRDCKKNWHILKQQKNIFSCCLIFLSPHFWVFWISLSKIQNDVQNRKFMKKLTNF